MNLASTRYLLRRRRQRVRRIYIPAVFSGGTAASSLVNTWSSDGDGFAASFENTPSIYVKDSGTPANDTNVTTASLTDFSTFFTFTSPTTKITRQADGTWNHQPHNRVRQSRFNNNSSSNNWTAVSESGATGDADAGTVLMSSVEGFSALRSNGTYPTDRPLDLYADVTCDTTIANVPIRVGAATSAFTLIDLTAGVTARVKVSGFVSFSTNFSLSVDQRSAIVPGGANETGYTVTFDNVVVVESGGQDNAIETNETNSNATNGYVLCAPPIHYNADGTAYGMKVEPASTNLIPNEDNRDTAPVFNVGGSATSAKTATGITGVANSAWTHTTTGALADAISHGIVSVTSDVFHITSAVYKRVSGDNWVVFESRFITAGSGIIYTWFDLENGVKGTSSVTAGTTTAVLDSYDLEDLGDGFYRIWMKLKTTTGTQMTTRVSSADSDGSLTGSGGSYINEMWQLEVATNLTKPSSPIRTYGASRTRTAENIRKATSALDLGSAFSVYVSYTLDRFSTFPTVFDISDGGATNRVDVYTNNDLAIYRASASGTNINMGSMSGVGAKQKIATRTQLDSFNGALNGTAGTADTSGAMPSGVTTLSVGQDRAASQQLGGYIHEIMVLPEGLADATLESITS